MQTKEIQAAITPAKALDILKEGNKRFVQNLKANRDLLRQVNETADGQYPYAVILSCFDSRTSAELIFDLGLGDIFSIRIAGNVINKDILGCMEFACKLAGSKLIVVLGHSDCGAVKSACDNIRLGNLSGLLDKLKPAIDSLKAVGGEDTSSNNAVYVQKVAGRNVLIAIEQIKQGSAVLEKLLENGQIGIAGGMYDVENGKVEFITDLL
ncbi:MAG: carbonic anhydrase family protein [Bacteroidota bacterium]